MWFLTTPAFALMALLLATFHGSAAAAAEEEAPWPWPLSPAPEVAAEFDAPDSDYGPGHRGIDLRSSPGQVVTSATAGEVKVAASVAGRGVVVVRLRGLRLTYEPVRPAVVVGEQVSPGQAIGTVQMTASHCAPDTCLHVGVRRQDAYIDPLPYFGPRHVRLKPLGGARSESGAGSSTPSERMSDAAEEASSAGTGVGERSDVSSPGSTWTTHAVVGAVVTVVTGMAAAAALRRRQARG
ncbi:MAG: peptidoglycan DD-metalloendopeptidase family protein [Nocardioidaceae bacterium]